MRSPSSESWASSPAARAVMVGNRRRDTRPELRLRKAAHARGLRYRVDTRPVPHVPCRADLVFASARLAVFVDGCFWHGCPEHHKPPSTNGAYWSAKVTRNIDRDRRADDILGAAGWLVLRIWEHEDPRAAAGRIADLVRLRRAMV